MYLFTPNWTVNQAENKLFFLFTKVGDPKQILELDRVPAWRRRLMMDRGQTTQYEGWPGAFFRAFTVIGYKTLVTLDATIRNFYHNDWVNIVTNNDFDENSL